jgi:transposase
MFYAGIDVAMDKHDCVVLDSGGNCVVEIFSFENSSNGFKTLHKVLKSCSKKPENIKVGLEATGHYSDNLLAFLNSIGYSPVLFNPLHTNLFRKGQSLRKTKTDRIDARSIALMLLTDSSLEPYSLTSYHNEELKSLTRYRFTKVQERAKYKTSVARLVSILFPELEKLVPTLHMKSVYAMLSEFPGASHIASAHLTRLTHLLYVESKGHYGKDKAIEIREAARASIGSVMPAKSLELSHTISLINILGNEIDEIEAEIKCIMDEIDSPILSIPGISYRMGAMIIAEIGDFDRFSSPDQILAYAGMSPSTYQSGQLTSSHAHMEKRGSKYLRYALFNATIYVCNWDPTFSAYLAKKRAEGKHYYVAITHAAKKLVRLIYALESSGEQYRIAV